MWGRIGVMGWTKGTEMRGGSVSLGDEIASGELCSVSTKSIGGRRMMGRGPVMMMRGLWGMSRGGGL